MGGRDDWPGSFSASSERRKNRRKNQKFIHAGREASRRMDWIIGPAEAVPLLHSLPGIFQDTFILSKNAKFPAMRGLGKLSLPCCRKCMSWVIGKRQVWSIGSMVWRSVRRLGFVLPHPFRIERGMNGRPANYCGLPCPNYRDMGCPGFVLPHPFRIERGMNGAPRVRRTLVVSHVPTTGTWGTPWFVLSHSFRTERGMNGAPGLNNLPSTLFVKCRDEAARVWWVRGCCRR